MSSVYPEINSDGGYPDNMPEHHPSNPTSGLPPDDSHWPAPDTSANWGYPNHDVTPTGGLDISTATMPADPMNFLPTSDPAGGYASPAGTDVDAPWGYPSHGVTDT